MMREMTIGQYYPADSKIHALDPRTKLFGTMVFIISLFLSNSILGYLLATAFLVLAVTLCQVPFGYMVKGLRAVFVLLMISVLFNLFWTSGGDEIFRLGFLRITMQGVRTAAFMAVRLVYLIIGSSVMTLTTTPNELTDGLEKGLRPLNLIKVPVHEIAMMMSIALRFIPILVEETDKIMKAQMARGADFESGNFLQKAKSLIPLLVPLFISAFRRATDLAMAMEARCYHGGQNRTKMKPLIYKSGDRIAYLFYAVYILSVIVIRMVL